MNCEFQVIVHTNRNRNRGQGACAPLLFTNLHISCPLFKLHSCPVLQVRCPLIACAPQLFECFLRPCSHLIVKTNIITSASSTIQREASTSSTMQNDHNVYLAENDCLILPNSFRITQKHMKTVCYATLFFAKNTTTSLLRQDKKFLTWASCPQSPFFSPTWWTVHYTDEWIIKKENKIKNLQVGGKGSK